MVEIQISLPFDEPFDWPHGHNVIISKFPDASCRLSVAVNNPPFKVFYAIEMWYVRINVMSNSNENCIEDLHILHLPTTRWTSTSRLFRGEICSKITATLLMKVINHEPVVDLAYAWWEMDGPDRDFLTRRQGVSSDSLSTNVERRSGKKQFLVGNLINVLVNLQAKDSGHLPFPTERNAIDTTLSNERESFVPSTSAGGTTVLTKIESWFDAEMSKSFKLCKCVFRETLCTYEVWSCESSASENASGPPNRTNREDWRPLTEASFCNLFSFNQSKVMLLESGLNHWGVGVIIYLQKFPILGVSWVDKFWQLITKFGDPKMVFTFYFPFIFPLSKHTAQEFFIAGAVSEFLNMTFKW
uniref:Uncharacterized protein n=1 Tax=Romanomermis culicivorax TaxID=13658 RepID=A0A915K3G7_ROMCU